MGMKTRAAGILRSMGAGAIIDSPKVRSAFGVPVYKKRAPKPQPAPGAPIVQRGQAKTVDVVIDGPKLSVIIPCYNVEQYVEACVHSVTGQTYKNLEIIIVDDGSKDKTGALVDTLALKDPRITVVHKVNAGLGFARNTGLEYATGRYITFVDSDDIVPPNAYRTMMDSLLASGSDVAIGAVERFNSTRQWVPSWVNEIHGEDRIGVTGAEFPPITFDVFSWNKIYKFDTWKRVVGAFPDGLYEDQEGTANLYINDQVKLDILTEIVYRWRFRDDGTSITQNKSSVADLAERLRVAALVNDIYANCQSQEIYDYWIGKLVCEDLYWYYREVPRAEDEFWQYLTEVIPPYYAKAKTDELRKWPLDRRLIALAIARGDRKAFDRVLFDSLERGTHTAIEHRGDQWIATVPGVANFAEPVPTELMVVDPEQFTSEIVLTDIQYAEDASLTISGFANIVDVAPDANRVLRAWIDLPEQSGIIEEQRLPLLVEPVASKYANSLSKNPFIDLSTSGFVITITGEDIEKLLTISDEHEAVALSYVANQVLPLRMSIEQDGLTLENCQIDRLAVAGTTRSLHASRVTANGYRLVPQKTADDFGLKFLAPRFFAQKVKLQDRQLELEVVLQEREAAAVRARIGNETPKLIVASDSVYLSSAPLQPTEDPLRWSASLLLPERHDLVNENVLWCRVEIETPGYKAALAVDCVEDFELSGEHYSAFASQFGYLLVAASNQYGTVESANFNEDTNQLTLAGVYFNDTRVIRQSQPTFALVGKEGNVLPSRVVTDPTHGRYEVTFDLTYRDADGVEVAVSREPYIFEMLTATGKKLPASVWMRRSRGLETQLPMRHDFNCSRVVVEAAPRNNGVVVNVGAGISEEMSGAHPQYVAAQIFNDESRQLRNDVVLFESFGGSRIADSCKAIDAYLAAHRPELQRFWTVRDGSIAVPDGATPVVLWSEEWFKILATAKYLVNNNNFPFFFRKHPEQRYLQVWHGTPLKKIGHDVPNANLSLSYRALMDRESQYWDALVAQSAWAKPVLANAFHFEGETLALGYPRNDSIVNDLATNERRQTVRQFLGLSDDQLVVLYAPTWRDNVKNAAGRYGHTLYLDFAAVQRRFGKDVMILQRGHSNTIDSGALNLPANVINVNNYPDINDLYLAADVLVTDYSSVMFDFALTRRPMIFLAPDIELYRDVTRGFYFDFEAMAPGPIVDTTKQVIEHLEDMPGLTANFQRRYEAFLAKFAPLDNGLAAERVVKHFFG